MHLYKYYPPKKHNFKAIAQKKIFFCYPSSLNDPNDTSITNIQAFPQFCRGLDVDNQKLKESLDRHAICCFSKGSKADNCHLWTFYASNYEGFAVEYDENVLKDLAAVITGPLPLLDVDYRDNPLNLDADETFAIAETFDIEHREQHSINQCIEAYQKGDHRPIEELFKELHLQKDRSVWEEEKECRLIVGNVILGNLNGAFRRFFQKVNNKGLLFTLPANAIKSITIGYRTSDKSKRLLKKIASKLGVKLFQATPCVENCRWTVRLYNISAKANKP